MGGDGVWVGQPPQGCIGRVHGEPQSSLHLLDPIRYAFYILYFLLSFYQVYFTLLCVHMLLL